MRLNVVLEHVLLSTVKNVLKTAARMANVKRRLSFYAQDMSEPIMAYIEQVTAFGTRSGFPAP